MRPGLWRGFGLLLCLLPLCSAAQVTVRDDLGVHRFAAPPRRVIALTWESAESLLEMGVQPLGVAEADGYRKWVVQPALPARTRGVGTRLEPNLELLAALKPDLIIISPVLRALQPQLTRIAPVLLFDVYRSDHDNAARALAVYRELARLFDRQALAEARLQQLSHGLDALRDRLHRHWGNGAPPVRVVRFAGPTVAYVYGRNAMPVQALQCLGLQPAVPDGPATAWGITPTPLLAMGGWRGDAVLYQLPFDQAGRLFGSPLWQAMPFVRARRVAAVASTWSYGGVFSLYYLARAMTDALLTLSPAGQPARPFAVPGARDCVIPAAPLPRPGRSAR